MAFSRASRARRARQAPSVEVIARFLKREYPDSRLGNKANPLDELAFIVLSGQTTSALAERAYRGFKTAFPRWLQVADASVRDIESAIGGSGLGRQKARYLRSIARRLRQDFGAVTLAPLKSMTTTVAEQYLCSLPGIGIKSARCVLMYSLARKVFPADVHCLRIMDRLGWLKWGRRRGELLADTAQELIPRRLRHLLHIRFVQHGRAVCGSKPRCDFCVVRDYCPSTRLS